MGCPLTPDFLNKTLPVCVATYLLHKFVMSFSIGVALDITIRYIKKAPHNKHNTVQLAEHFQV